MQPQRHLGMIPRFGLGFALAAILGFLGASASTGAFRFEAVALLLAALVLAVSLGALMSRQLWRELGAEPALLAALAERLAAGDPAAARELAPGQGSGLLATLPRRDALSLFNAFLSPAAESARSLPGRDSRRGEEE